MNSSSVSVVRFKINPDIICKSDKVLSLTHPREDFDGKLYVCSQAGQILCFNDYGNEESSFKVLCTVVGQPYCVAFVDDGFFYSDIANASINKFTRFPDDTFSDDCHRKDYEGFPFKGPTSLFYNKEDEMLIYCDSGYFGSSSLNKPNGSIYIEESNGMRPILLNCLANPADIAIDSGRGVIYVCETFTNRILRISHIGNQPITSVFYQFAGRVGPTAIALDDPINGNLYVARYDFKETDEKKIVDGLISVINRDGILLGEIIIPNLPEITGLLIPSKNREVIYFTEKNTSAVLGLKLGAFLNQLSHYEDNIKIN